MFLAFLACGIPKTGGELLLAKVISKQEPVQAPPPASPSAVPHLNGTFLSLYSADLANNASRWDQEFEAMASVGISFVAVRAALQGTSSEIAGGCTLGTYSAFYPTKMQPRPCFVQAPASEGGGALGLVLDAAKAHGVRVHITPAMPHTPFAWPPSHATQPNKTKEEYYDQLTALQADTFADVWAAFPRHHGTIVGVYTTLEEWNGPTWMSESNIVPLATRYFEPLAKRVRSDSGVPALQVWASPYFVGNLTLHPTAQSAADYAAYWGKLWDLAPSFDWIALQDSMGWQGNSLPEVSAVLSSLRHAASAAGRRPRQLFSNVELFEGTNPDGSATPPCIYPARCGRHPAPIERIVRQLAAEHPYVVGHLAWEWASCLSPFANENTSALFADYKAYVSGAVQYGAQ
jgi:hypothetical protein